MGNNSTIKIGSCVDAFAPGYRLLRHTCTDSSACYRPTSNILHTVVGDEYIKRFKQEPSLIA